MNRLILLFCLTFSVAQAQHQEQMSLNGIWNFDQTERAFPPQEFTRTIPVPGLVHLATPRIVDYDKLFKRPERVVFQEQHNLEDRTYEPKYNWYQKTIRVPAALEGKQAVLTIKKSKYVTRVFVNGMEAGSSIECYTPIDVDVTDFLRFGQDNELLIQVGDRAWLPSAAAGSIDKEKVNYLPGIWDDVFLSFTDRFRVHRALMLPNVQDSSLTAKLLIHSFYPPQLTYGAPMTDSCRVEIKIREKQSGKVVAQATQRVIVKRDNRSEIHLTIPMKNPHLWTPDDPFMYTAEVKLSDQGQESDVWQDHFGMRTFGREGKFFTLNNEKTILRGTNITLHRFFEDPACQALPWDSAWVRKLLVDIPDSLHWNAMRICVGIVPDFWYDLADEAGLMLQNEWLYWQNHGWDEQIRREYTDWVWSDGNHPSIAIWDAINENWDDYIGTQLIPELKKLDNTRMWDAGYMTTEELGTLDEMDEPHPYLASALHEDYAEFRDQYPYPLGDLNYPAQGWQERFENSTVPQLVNEYGWMWLWRDGSPSKLTVKNYDYYLDSNATDHERQELQAYWLQLQTEWLRSEPSIAGVLHFCYLTNNYGFTGDGFLEPIAELKLSPMLQWFKHAFAPQAVFIDMIDGRYMKHVAPYSPGSNLSFDLISVNDLKKEVYGRAVVKLLDATGKKMLQQELPITMNAYARALLPVSLTLPPEPGGYLLLVEYYPQGQTAPVLSRRYLRVGEAEQYEYASLTPEAAP